MKILWSHFLLVNPLNRAELQHGCPFKWINVKTKTQRGTITLIWMQISGCHSGITLTWSGRTPCWRINPLTCMKVAEMFFSHFWSWKLQWYIKAQSSYSLSIIFPWFQTQEVTFFRFRIPIMVYLYLFYDPFNIYMWWFLDLYLFCDFLVGKNHMFLFLGCPKFSLGWKGVIIN